MAIKLIVFDVDGTIVADDHYTVPAENSSALREARSRGIQIAVASGRTWSILTPVTEQVGGVDYAIISNGAAVIDTASGERLYEKEIPLREALILMDVLDQENLPYEIYCGGQNYVAERMTAQLGNGLLSGAFTEMYMEHVKIVPDLREILQGRNVEKFNLFYAPMEIRERIRAELMQKAPLEIANALEGNMEFTYGGVCKGAALEYLCKQKGFTADEVLFFGDAGNDVEALRWTGHSYAMENGAEVAKKAAKAIAPKNTLGGVGLTVRKYLSEQ